MNRTISFLTILFISLIISAVAVSIAGYYARSVTKKPVTEEELETIRYDLKEIETDYKERIYGLENQIAILKENIQQPKYRTSKVLRSDAPKACLH